MRALCRACRPEPFNFKPVKQLVALPNQRNYNHLPSPDTQSTRSAVAEHKQNMAAPLSSLRLLIVSPPRLPYSPSPVPSVLHALTGSLPTQDQVSSGFAGYTQHPPVRLRTKYYDANIGIWCDEVPVPEPGAEDLVNAKSAQVSNSASDCPASVGQATEVGAHHHGLSPSDGARIGDVAQTTLTDDDSAAEALPSLSTWRNTMLSEPAREVREAVGGILLALPLPISLASNVSPSTSKQGHSEGYLEIVQAVDEVREMIEEENYGREVAAVVLVTATGKGVGEGDLDATTEKLETVMREERGMLGWEFVGWNGDVGEDGFATSRFGGLRNAFGERMGMERVKELLEAVDWSASGDGLGGKDIDVGFLSSDDEDGALGLDGIKRQGQELEREMMGLKLAMRDQGLGKEDAEEIDATSQDAGEEEDLKIDQLPSLLERVVAIRDAGADMNKTDRERFARREVERIMKDLT
jgi:hypothetical protein